jgi:hypothetical protein
MNNLTYEQYRGMHGTDEAAARALLKENQRLRAQFKAVVLELQECKAPTQPEYVTAKKCATCGDYVPDTKFCKGECGRFER